MPYLEKAALQQQNRRKPDAAQQCSRDVAYVVQPEQHQQQPSQQYRTMPQDFSSRATRTAYAEAHNLNSAAPSSRVFDFDDATGSSQPFDFGQDDYEGHARPGRWEMSSDETLHGVAHGLGRFAAAEHLQ